MDLAMRTRFFVSGRPRGTSFEGRKEAGIGEEKKGSKEEKGGRRERFCARQRHARQQVEHQPLTVWSMGTLSSAYFSRTPIMYSKVSSGMLSDVGASFSLSLPLVLLSLPALSGIFSFSRRGLPGPLVPSAFELNAFNHRESSSSIQYPNPPKPPEDSSTVSLNRMKLTGSI
jgi:hypothetical protein